MTDETPKPSVVPAGTKAPKRLTRRELERRRLILRSIGAGVAAVAAGLVGWYPVGRQIFDRLRPPGALAERDFLSACIKCGQCVQVCPVEAIRLGDGDEGYGIGVPFINAREQACDFSCDAVQCVLACPTGALSHEIARKEEVTMGRARLARPVQCLAVRGEGFKGLARGYDFKGLMRQEEVDRWTPIPLAEYPYDVALCDLCVRECPIEGAIALEPLTAEAGEKRHAPVVTDKCVGCGACEMVCPAEPAAIVIDTELTLAAEAGKGAA